MVRLNDVSMTVISLRNLVTVDENPNFFVLTEKILAGPGPHLICKNVLFKHRPSVPSNKLTQSGFIKRLKVFSDMNIKLKNTTNIH